MSAALCALTLPRTVFGAGALGQLDAELSVLRVTRPLLLSDAGLVKAGLVARAIAACGAREVAVFGDVTENPCFDDADRGLAQYLAARCDSVVALGGGSVIDTAKFIALLAANGGRTADYAGVPSAPHGPAVPLVVLPTTAGTGSEASPSAGIHPDPATALLGMNSRHLVPRVALLDPALTTSLPPRLTAATGIDALSHCIEGYFSKRAVPLGKAIALDGIGRVTRHLRRAVEQGDDIDARGEMLLAAYAGGVAIGMGLGPAHAIALSCSDRGLHHGVLSGIGLVASLDAVAAAAPGPAADLQQALGIAPAASLSTCIAALMQSLRLPITLKESGYGSADLDALAIAAHRSHFNLSAPFHPSAADYARMIGASLEGRLRS